MCAACARAEGKTGGKERERERVGKKRNRLTKDNNDRRREREREGRVRQTGGVVGGGWREPT